jgi:hypothetical protein
VAGGRGRAKPDRQRAAGPPSKLSKQQNFIPSKNRAKKKAKKKSQKESKTQNKAQHSHLQPNPPSGPT